jgi:hypothetical protein
MNLNTVGAFVACVLTAPYSSSAPVYTETPAAAEEISGHDAIVRVLSSRTHNQELVNQARGELDLSRQVYFEVAAVDVAQVNTSDAGNATGKLDTHSYAVFKTVSIPPPAQLISPTEKPDRKKSNGRSADAIDITSEDFMLSNLTRSVVEEVQQYQAGDRVGRPVVSTETRSVLAVTNDDLVDPAQARKRKNKKKLESMDVDEPSQSTFLYRLLCKTGLMTPEKVGLSNDCD